MTLQYAYIIGDLVLVGIWLTLFTVRKDLRREIITASLATAPLGPLSELFYLRDYWHPVLLGGLRIGLEDVIFAFAIGGIASVIYEAVFKVHQRPSKTRKHHRSIAYICMAGVVVMIVGTIFLGFNSIYVSTAGFLIVGLCIAGLRHDLLPNALFSGILLSVLFLCWYTILQIIFPGIFQAWWKLSNLSGFFVGGIPAEELLWAFGWGFMAGPIYEYWAGIKNLS